ncbi:MAG TPA: hypothetical protein VGR06_42705 [Actinophytocola sp.]|nr:hypothetical protein [Actinophytocola sp.]
MERIALFLIGYAAMVVGIGTLPVTAGKDTVTPTMVNCAECTIQSGELNE